MTTAQRLRCAIYTRKSSEEGLDQEFNSLDAQREACSAFIASQVGLGWKLVADRYDDGGISGGTMERPALKRLLSDISAKRIDVVVVYKIDRLTRSLTDFARIVEVFDTNSVSFVSVTQQFNTTTSMGRLTLNVLLSFAQFEREVTAERIRDKIAASKKKGLWMGGTVPLGFQVRDRKLLIKEPEASFVRSLFSRYLELKSVPALAAEVTSQANRAVQTQGDPQPTGYTRKVGSGMLYKMLANPIYIGKLKHHDNVYDGEHDAIIDAELFAAVQHCLGEQAATPRGSAARAGSHLLTGLLIDETGDRMSPTHAKAHGRRYRYYISSRLKGKSRIDNAGWRIPASEVETITTRFILKRLDDRSQLVDWIRTHAPSADLSQCLDKAAGLRGRLAAAMHAEQRTILQAMLHRILLSPQAITFSLNAGALMTLLQSKAEDGTEDRKDDATAPTLEDHDQHGSTIDIDLAVTLKRRGNEMRLIIQNDDLSQNPDPSLVSLIARAHLYLQRVTQSPGISVSDVATDLGVHPADVGRILPLAFLCPKLTDQILRGQQAEGISARKLARANLPNFWADQLPALC